MGTLMEQLSPESYAAFEKEGKEAPGLDDLLALPDNPYANIENYEEYQDIKHRRLQQMLEDEEMAKAFLNTNEHFKELIKTNEDFQNILTKPLPEPSTADKNWHEDDISEDLLNLEDVAPQAIQKPLEDEDLLSLATKHENKDLDTDDLLSLQEKSPVSVSPDDLLALS